MTVYIILCEYHGKYDPVVSITDTVYSIRSEAVRRLKQMIADEKEYGFLVNELDEPFDPENWEIEESDTRFEAYNENFNIWITFTLIERFLQTINNQTAVTSPHYHND